MPLLSVIIPIYKVEHTLDRCVRSVLVQDVDMEVILVDDGSPDKCPEMCDIWARKDGRVKVIHKRNGGLSDARNAGISASQGMFLAFVDSDDEVGEGTFSQVLKAFDDKCDIVEFPISEEHADGTSHIVKFQQQTYDVSSKELLLQYWLEKDVHTHCYAHNKMFRRHIFDEVRFPVGRVYEDIWILPELLDKAKQVKSIDKGVYVYHYNKEGICRSQKHENARLQSLLHAAEKIGVEWDREEAQTMLMDVLNCQLQAYMLNRETDERVKACVPFLKLSAARSWRERLKLILLRHLGIDGLCFLLSLVNILDFRTFHIKHTAE